MFKRAITLLSLGVLIAGCSGEIKEKSIKSIDIKGVSRSDYTGSDKAIVDGTVVSGILLKFSNDSFEKGKRFLYGGTMGASTKNFIGYGLPLSTKIIEMKRDKSFIYFYESKFGKYLDSPSAPVDLLDKFPIVKEEQDGVVVDFSAGKSRFEINNVGLDIPMQSVIVHTHGLRKVGDTFMYRSTIQLRPLIDPEHKIFQKIKIPFKSTATVHFFIKPFAAKKDGFERRTPIKNFGYFMSDTSVRDPDGSLHRATKYVSHWDLSNQIVYKFSKNFPDRHKETVKEAIAEWNKVLGADKIKIEDMSADEDLADITSNVIYWEDDLSLAFAGAYGPLAIDPYSGEILGGDVYIGGSKIEQLVGYVPPANTPSSTDVQSIINNIKSKLRTDRLMSQMKIKYGSMDIQTVHRDGIEEELLRVSLEKRSDINFDAAKMMKELLKDLIVHELGHTFGLRHNFKGSQEKNDKQPAFSVMDYLPFGNIMDTLGPYDIAAVKYSYFGEEPKKEFPYCTDEDQKGDPNCNKFDIGDSFTYYETSFNKIMSQLLTQFAPWLMEQRVNMAAMELSNLMNFLHPSIEKANQQKVWGIILKLMEPQSSNNQIVKLVNQIFQGIVPAIIYEKANKQFAKSAVYMEMVQKMSEWINDPSREYMARAALIASLGKIGDIGALGYLNMSKDQIERNVRKLEAAIVKTDSDIAEFSEELTKIKAGQTKLEEELKKLGEELAAIENQESPEALAVKDKIEKKTEEIKTVKTQIETAEKSVTAKKQLKISLYQMLSLERKVLDIAVKIITKI